MNMSEKAFSFFRSPKKRGIDPGQDPLELLTRSDLKQSDFLAFMAKMREQKAYTRRTLFPGSFKADDFTLMVDTQLPLPLFVFVGHHEYVHALLSQLHYGEMIRRLEDFNTLAFQPLAEIRALTIARMFLEEQGTNYKPEKGEKYSRAMREFLRRVGLDETTRQRIRERLASDQLFMRGLRFLDKIDKRKSLLLAHWKKPQEGGAYWLSLHSHEQMVKDYYEKAMMAYGDTERREARELVENVRAKLLQAEDENGEGFRMVQKIAEAWGAHLVFTTLGVILSPDITHLSILHSSLSEISQQLNTTRFSPDRRLEAVCKIAISGSFVPKDEDDVLTLYKLLDHGNPTPRLSMDSFNVYWNTLDADPEFISLMSDLYRRVGLERGYEPIQVPEGRAEASVDEVLDAMTVMNHERQVLQKGAGEREDEEYSRRKISMDKDIFLETMRREGLIKAPEQVKSQRAGGQSEEAAILNNTALIYRVTGRLREALKLYEEALSLQREVGDRVGESTTLNNIALVHQRMGEPQEALKLYEHSLRIAQQLADRAAEAITLNNIARVYQAMGKLQEAMALYKQALLIAQTVGDRNGEAIILNNIAAIYHDTDRLQEAFKFYEQALEINREVGNRWREAAILNNLALIYKTNGESRKALKLYEQALEITRVTGNKKGEATTLVNIAWLFHNLFDRQQDAVTTMEQAIDILVHMGLPLDAPLDAGGSTIRGLQDTLDAMRKEEILEGQERQISKQLDESTEQLFIDTTVGALTIWPERFTGWREQMVETVRDAQKERDWRLEVDFFTAILDILDRQPLTFPPDHSYAQQVMAIQKGIAAGRPQVNEYSHEIVVAAVAELAIWDLIKSLRRGETRQVMEAEQELLFRPVAEEILEQYMALATSEGDQGKANAFSGVLEFLHDCKKNGIAQACEKFSALEEK
jgi:tetratricopeptide (TPR) repeat protein